MTSIAAAALCLLLVACGDDESGSADGRDVVILGDSITARSTEAIEELLPEATIVAAEGQQATYQTPEVPDADIVMLLLGTNDVWNGAPLDQVVATLETLGAQAECVGVMSLSTSSDGRMVAFGAVYDDEAAAEANEQIEPIGDVVIDWEAATAADPSLTEDGVHPTPEGQVRLAEMIRDGVEECG